MKTLFLRFVVPCFIGYTSGAAIGWIFKSFPQAIQMLILVVVALALIFYYEKALKENEELGYLPKY